MSWLKDRLVRWDVTLGAIVIAVAWVAATTVDGFTTDFNLSQIAAGVSERALIVLPLCLLIIAREIDLSIGSMVGLASVTLGIFLRDGVPLALAIAAVLVVGVLAGSLNGILVALFELPSLVVTLGTLALFRGVCLILLGPESVSILPPQLNEFGLDNVPGTFIPWVIVPFFVLAPLFAIVLHRMTTGRRIFAIGGGPDTALYSGVRVRRLKFTLFALSGFVCAIAGIIYTARLGSARADAAEGYELDAITIAFLGGISVFGGKGSLIGVIEAIALVAILRDALGLSEMSGDAQTMVIGVLLIVAVLLNNATVRISERAARRRHAVRAPP